MLQALIGPVAILLAAFQTIGMSKRKPTPAKLQVIQNDADWESKMAAASCQ